MVQENLVATNSPGDLPRSSGQIPKKKYYKVVDTDLYRNKKIIREGSIVDFFEPAFSSFLVPVNEADVPPSVQIEPETISSKPGRGRQRKN